MIDSVDRKASKFLILWRPFQAAKAFFRKVAGLPRTINKVFRSGNGYSKLSDESHEEYSPMEAKKPVITPKRASAINTSSREEIITRHLTPVRQQPLQTDSFKDMPNVSSQGIVEQRGQESRKSALVSEYANQNTVSHDHVLKDVKELAVAKDGDTKIRDDVISYLALDTSSTGTSVINKSNDYYSVNAGNDEIPSEKVLTSLEHDEIEKKESELKVVEPEQSIVDADSELPSRSDSVAVLDSYDQENVENYFEEPLLVEIDSESYYPSSLGSRDQNDGLDKSEEIEDFNDNNLSLVSSIKESLKGKGGAEVSESQLEEKPLRVKDTQVKTGYGYASASDPDKLLSDNQSLRQQPASYANTMKDKKVTDTKNEEYIASIDPEPNNIPHQQQYEEPNEELNIEIKALRERVSNFWDKNAALNDSLSHKEDLLREVDTELQKTKHDFFRSRQENFTLKANLELSENEREQAIDQRDDLANMNLKLKSANQHQQQRLKDVEAELESIREKNHKLQTIKKCAVESILIVLNEAVKESPSGEAFLDKCLQCIEDIFAAKGIDSDEVLSLNSDE